MTTQNLSVFTQSTVYVKKSTKEIRHFLYSRGWKQTKKGGWRSAYSPTAFDNVSDALRFDYQLRRGLSVREAFAAVPKFTYERTQREISKRRGTDTAAQRPTVTTRDPGLMGRYGE